MKKVRWVDFDLRKSVLVDQDGIILAVVSINNFTRTWSYSGEEYINIEAAQRAAEKHLGIKDQP